MRVCSSNSQAECGDPAGLTPRSLRGIPSVRIPVDMSLAAGQELSQCSRRILSSIGTPTHLPNILAGWPEGTDRRNWLARYSNGCMCDAGMLKIRNCVAGKLPRNRTPVRLSAVFDRPSHNLPLNEACCQRRGRGRLLSRCAGGAHRPPLLKTLAAIDGPPLCWLEGNRCFLAALRAHGLGFDPLKTAGPGIATLRADCPCMPCIAWARS